MLVNAEADRGNVRRGIYELHADGLHFVRDDDGEWFGFATVDGCPDAEVFKVVDGDLALLLNRVHDRVAGW